MTPRADYDIAILGGGLADLSLAMRLADPPLAHLRVLLVEARTDYHRDRTWSYWTLRSDATRTSSVESPRADETEVVGGTIWSTTRGRQAAACVGSSRS